jgi:hypothetical protein
MFLRGELCPVTFWCIETARQCECPKGCEQTQMVSPIVSMTLGNMRSLGVRALLLTCQACGYELRLNVDARSDDVAVSSFGLNLRCRRCRNVGADARPDWSERQEKPDGGRAPRLTPRQHRALVALATAGLKGAMLAAAKRGFNTAVIAGLVKACNRNA